MGVNIGSTSAYLWMDYWIMACILQLGTRSFCRRFLTRQIDPTGRQFDQMTQAARSGQANIAEGSSRHQTSRETEMKLIDVARASINEVASDFMMFILDNGHPVWSLKEPGNVSIRNIRLKHPEYSADLMHDVSAHILEQKKLFDPWIESDNPITAANALLVLCGRLNQMITGQLERYLHKFKSEGGFTENMTAERVETLKQQSLETGAPLCPICGKPMLRRTAKKGRNSGNQFWSCSDYPACTGTRPIHHQ